MEKFKDFVLEWDFFNHSTLHRYKERECYRTLTGGVISMLLVVFFIGMFANMTIDTFQTNLITSKVSVNYDDNPAKSILRTSTAQNFMFAIGITGMDLNSSQRYFDISLQHKSTVVTGSNKVKQTQIIALEPCTQAHWSGVNENIAQNFNSLSFSKWLCPSIGNQMTLQGKYTSNIFKYAQIKISKCTQNNTHFPGTTCKSTAQVSSFLNSFGQFTFNFYYINPVINADQKQYLKYYLEDRNYFSFDMQTGVLGNLFFSDWTVTSDQSIFPWEEKREVSGLKTIETASDQDFKIDSSNTYFKFYLRKSASNYQTFRFHQKIDKTFSYIGGLFGTIILLLSFLKLYSKYCYELQLGDRIFKQDNNGSFGSENFNFIIFFGYIIFNVLTKFNTFLEWKVMKKFHQCRSECQKQLNISLLFKKMAHLEEATKIFLEGYQEDMLLLMPKPTIQEIKRNRKRFYVKSMLYKAIEGRGREIAIHQDDYKRRIFKFFDERNSLSEDNMEQTIPDNQDGFKKRLQFNVVSNYVQLQRQSQEQNQLSNRILERLNHEELARNIFLFISEESQLDGKSERHHHQKEGSDLSSKQQSNLSVKPLANHIQMLQENEIIPVQFEKEVLPQERKQKISLQPIKLKPMSSLA